MLRNSNNTDKDSILEALRANDIPLVRAQLSFLKSLELGYASLSDNLLGDNLLRRLAIAMDGNNTILSLDLTGNSLMSHHARSIADILCGQNVLRSLDIYNNEIDEEGASHILRAVKSNQRMIHLNIKWNDISEETKAELFECVNTNKSRQISILRDLAEQQRFSNMEAAAINLYSLILEIDPFNGPILARRASLHEEMGNYSVAFKDYSRAIQYSREHPDLDSWCDRKVSLQGRLWNNSAAFFVSDIQGLETGVGQVLVPKS